LTYNFLGTSTLYLRRQLFTTFGDLKDRFMNCQDSKEASDFTPRFYDRNREIASWLRNIHGHETVFEDFDFGLGGVEYQLVDRYSLRRFVPSKPDDAQRHTIHQWCAIASRRNQSCAG
jgi:hypothetical protein